MSEESDVDLDMEGVVEVNFNVFYLIWDKTFSEFFTPRIFFAPLA